MGVGGGAEKGWVQHKVRGVNSPISVRGTQPDWGQILIGDSS